MAPPLPGQPQPAGPQVRFVFQPAGPAMVEIDGVQYEIHVSKQGPTGPNDWVDITNLRDWTDVAEQVGQLLKDLKAAGRIGDLTKTKRADVIFDGEFTNLDQPARGIQANNLQAREVTWVDTSDKTTKIQGNMLASVAQTLQLLGDTLRVARPPQPAAHPPARQQSASARPEAQATAQLPLVSDQPLNIVEDTRLRELTGRTLRPQTSLASALADQLVQMNPDQLRKEHKVGTAPKPVDQIQVDIIAKIVQHLNTKNVGPQYFANKQMFDEMWQLFEQIDDATLRNTKVDGKIVAANEIAILKANEKPAAADQPGRKIVFAACVERLRTTQTSQGLETTFLAVFKQTFSEYDLIVLDGQNVDQHTSGGPRNVVPSLCLFLSKAANGAYASFLRTSHSGLSNLNTLPRLPGSEAINNGLISVDETGQCLDTSLVEQMLQIDPTWTVPGIDLTTLEGKRQQGHALRTAVATYLFNENAAHRLFNTQDLFNQLRETLQAIPASEQARDYTYNGTHFTAADIQAHMARITDENYVRILQDVQWMCQFYAAYITIPGTWLDSTFLIALSMMPHANPALVSPHCTVDGRMQIQILRNKPNRQDGEPYYHVIAVYPADQRPHGQPLYAWFNGQNHYMSIARTSRLLQAAKAAHADSHMANFLDRIYRPLPQDLAARAGILTELIQRDPIGSAAIGYLCFSGDRAATPLMTQVTIGRTELAQHLMHTNHFFATQYITNLRTHFTPEAILAARNLFHLVNNQVTPRT